MIRKRLFTPGPVMLPDAVHRAMSAPFPHHRSDEFRAVLAGVLEALREFHRACWPVLPLTASGSGAMEAAVVNLLSPGDRAVVVGGGKFGERWGEICARWGIQGDLVDVEWGRSVDLDRVEDAFRAQPDARALLVTHSETSTGALHDLEGLARIAASRGALVAVDAITSLLVHDLAAEDWSLDIVVSGSQKALMAPPGMSFLCVSPRALDAARRSKSPRCYFDVIRAVEALAKGDTPWTPAITTVLALAESCALIRSEGGVGASVRRHARIARAVRAAMRGLGLRLLAAEPSNALTAVVAPDGIDTGAFVKKLDHDFGVRLAGGQGRLKGRVFRIGHMGFLDDQDLLGAVHAIESTFAAMGCALPPGGGIGAMRESLRPGDGS